MPASSNFIYYISPDVSSDASIKKHYDDLNGAEYDLMIVETGENSAVVPPALTF